MKHLITSLFVYCTVNAQAQSFDHIVYKQAVNKAYELAIKQKKYSESLQQLETVKSNYGMLYGEDYRLQAYCYKMMGNDSLTALSLKTCWSTPSFDMRTLWYVSELDPGKMMNGFNEYENQLVNEGFENGAKLRPKNADSLLTIFNKWIEEDQALWKEWEIIGENEELRARIDAMNRKHEAFIENYVRTSGYPGEKQLQLMDMQVWLILIHTASDEAFYQRMKPVFLNEVKIGNMSPWMYANWVDQHQFYKNLPTIYNSQVGVKKDLTRRESEEIRKNRFKIGLMDLEFTHPNY